MTFRERLADRIFKLGLSETDAKMILEQYISAQEGQSKDIKWDDPVSGYKQELLNAVWPGLHQFTVKWINTNHPGYWAKALLA